jgi:hypothetical protein
MRHLCRALCSIALLLFAGSSARAQAPTDVYHVHFTKAALGQAAALGESLRVPDPKAAMPGHFLLLRHQHGDDWDYAVIEHLGQKPTVLPTAAAPTPATNQRDWHEDTFAAGPSWAEFSKAMGLAPGSPAGIYTVSMWRTAPGHRPQLEKVLGARNPASKVTTGNVVLQHLEGGAWTFLTLTRYNSWQDFAADQPAPGTALAQWGDIRGHGAFHRDTVADRIPPK